jgi:hypothetical protein
VTAAGTPYLRCAAIAPGTSMSMNCRCDIVAAGAADVGGWAGATDAGGWAVAGGSAGADDGGEAGG